MLPSTNSCLDMLLSANTCLEGSAIDTSESVGFYSGLMLYMDIRVIPTGKEEGFEQLNGAMTRIPDIARCES
jgi:hypothetical protein